MYFNTPVFVDESDRIKSCAKWTISGLLIFKHRYNKVDSITNTCALRKLISAFAPAKPECCCPDSIIIFIIVIITRKTLCGCTGLCLIVPEHMFENIFSWRDYMNAFRHNYFA